MTREEMLLQARKAQNAQELLSLAADHGMEMTEESANAYFDQMSKIGELSDDELDNVKLSLELFESYTKGFISACAGSLTKAEVEHLAFSAKLMTYECGIRFLTDYLDGDVYFKTAYHEHNLVRARTQFKLVEDIEAKFDEMKAIVDEAKKHI